MPINIVILDGQLTNPGDLSWNPIKNLGDLTIYPATKESEIIERSHNADVLIVNKIELDKSHFEQLTNLRLICLLATGYDNINLEDAKAFDIVICNAVGYGVDSVAQHVFALLLSCYGNVGLHNASIQKGEWTQNQWSYSLSALRELSGKTIGIYGLGKIGKRVAEISIAFGMKVIAHHKHPNRDKREGVTFVTLKNLFVVSDVVTLHAPLSISNSKIVNKEFLNLMKDDSVLINTGRGGLVDEVDLRSHLLSHPDFMAALDVLSEEPPKLDHPLIGISNCILTPHHAWATKEARGRLIEIVSKNIEGFLGNKVINQVGL